jgi:D-alanyl-D-alanine carboxypeptidase/D-alanyl-D-alanine-endopeptidase (penicillin-binding protein 4)
MMGDGVKMGAKFSRCLMVFLCWVLISPGRNHLTGAVAQEPPQQTFLRISPATKLTDATSVIQSSICPAQLNAAITAVINRPQLRRARWGILIDTQSADRQPLFAYEAERYFLPASTAKLLTTAAALHRLGATFRIRTSVYQVKPDAQSQPQTTILRVVGRGDPSFRQTHLQTLAQQLRQHGIRRIDRLIVDDQYFRGTLVHPTWAWEDVQADVGVPVNALILNQNAIGLQLLPRLLGQPLQIQWDDPRSRATESIDNLTQTVASNQPEFIEIHRHWGRSRVQIRGQLRVGSAPESVGIPYLDPAQQFLDQFQQALEQEQMQVVHTQVADRPAPAGELEMAAIESPPLTTWLAEINQESNNLYADVLLKTLGIRQGQPDHSSTWEAGITALKESLTALGVDPNSYQLVDGSGLSRHNLVSPQALVQTLRGMTRSPHAQVYRASLATAGQSGTLKSRFQNTPIQGVLFAKTGTLKGTATLAGYLTPPDFEPLVLSVMINNSDQPAGILRAAIDEIVLLLTHLQRC